MSEVDKACFDLKQKLKQGLGNISGKSISGYLLCTGLVAGTTLTKERPARVHTVSPSLTNMTFRGQSILLLPWVPERVLAVPPTQYPVPGLTFQWLHGMPTPAALQRSGSGPSARCPAALPCSVGSGDGSGWPLQMVLPRQRSTEHHSPDSQCCVLHLNLPSFPLLGRG